MMYPLNLGMVQKLMHKYQDKGKLDIDMLYFFQQVITHVNNQIFLKEFYMQSSFSINPYDLSDQQIKEVMRHLGFDITITRLRKLATIRIIGKLE